MYFIDMKKCHRETSFENFLGLLEEITKENGKDVYNFPIFMKREDHYYVIIGISRDK